MLQLYPETSEQASVYVYYAKLVDTVLAVATAAAKHISSDCEMLPERTMTIFIFSN